MHLYYECLASVVQVLSDLSRRPPSIGLEKDVIGFQSDRGAAVVSR